MERVLLADEVRATLEAFRKVEKEEAVDRNVKSLQALQWAVYVYTALVHAGLRDVMPRVARMFLVYEVRGAWTTRAAAAAAAAHPTPTHTPTAQTPTAHRGL